MTLGPICPRPPLAKTAKDNVTRSAFVVAGAAFTRSSSESEFHRAVTAERQPAKAQQRLLVRTAENCSVERSDTRIDGSCCILRMRMRCGSTVHSRRKSDDRNQNRHLRVRLEGA